MGAVGGGDPFHRRAPAHMWPELHSAVVGDSVSPSLLRAGSLRMDGPHRFIVASSSLPSGDVGGYLGK